MSSFYTNLLFVLVTTALLEGMTGNFVDLPGTTTAEGPIVHTDKGPIQGIINEFPGKIFATSFLGVPYAKPPTCDLRFKAPEKMDEWTETKQTKTTQNACPQTVIPIPGFEAFTVTSTSEDCLYLNVFLPSQLNKEARLPVMVWLHGGGFTGGSSTLEAYDGRYLALQSQAIIVTVNYRLGFLGFMRMGDVKGNMGLLDQKAALEWVRDNIAMFGGDPNKVTLFGQSAGASSVSLHLVSQQSSGLFQKAIVQSGSFLSPWSFVDVTTAEERSKLVAQKVGCVSTDPAEVMKCLMGKSADLLVGMQVLIAQVTPWWFVPTIDGDFINKHPKELLDGLEKKIPIMFGSTDNEGSLFTSFMLQKYLTGKEPYLLDEKVVPELSTLFYYYPYYKQKTLLNKIPSIVSQYPASGSQKVLQNFQTITNALSDTWFVCPINDFGSLYACDDSYNYLFTQTLPKKLLPIFGATHGLELVFSFSSVIKYGTYGNFTENDKRLSEKIISFWSNFARTGNPNPTASDDKYAPWPAYKADEPKYLTLNEKFLDGREEAVVTGSFRGEYCSFWTQLLSQQ